MNKEMSHLLVTLSLWCLPNIFTHNNLKNKLQIQVGFNV